MAGTALPVSENPPMAKSCGAVRLAVAAIALAGLAFAGAPLGGSLATITACAAILLFGLPHGALDLALLRREGSRGPRRLVPLIALYLGCAAAAWLVWRWAPDVALMLFLGVAVIHFAEDWSATGSGFLAASLALSLLAAPALFHRPALREIFTALTGRPQSAAAAEVLLIVAPTAIGGAFAGVFALVRAGRRDLAAAAAVSMAAMAALPPAVGFALFFCLFHSPRYFGEAVRLLDRRRAARWAPIVVPVTLLALALTAAVYLSMPANGFSLRLVAATFMVLWVLTTPHIFVPLVLRALGGVRARIPASAAA